MKIEKVILYKTGIGYFVRKGKINMAKEKKIHLSFKTNVMNDILKTLSIISTKGVVTSVSYEASDIDTARALEDALIRIPEKDSFLALIKQLIGVQIIVTVGSLTLNGRVLGVQEIEERIKDKSFLEPYLVIVTDTNKVKNLRVKEIESLEIDDTKMNKELKFFLETIYLGKKKDTKTLTIFLEGNDEAELYITYLQEMPSWKTSYRLISTAENEYLLQGWALVDNILDEDWEDIDLSLISGLPISFIYDLYTPNWIRRPTIKRLDTFDITPPSFEETTGIMQKAELKEKETMKLYAMGGARRRTSTADADDMPVAGARLDDSIKVAAKGEAGGAGFEYRISVPVTVKRNQSSLVPILQSKITAKKLCVFNAKNHPTNPMMCLELLNDTDLTLEKGPISIYEQDSFSGEAMLPHMQPKEKRLIAHGVELGVSVSSDSQYRTTNIHDIKIGKYAETFQFSIHQTKYTIKNKTDEEKTLIIEHPKEYQYDLYETKKPQDETDNYYRYELKLAPMKTDQFEVKLRKIEKQSRYLNQIAKKDIENWYELKLISVVERDFLLNLYELELQKQEIDNQLIKINNEITTISSDQERIRENLKSLGDSQSEKRLKEKYVSKFETQEETLEKMRKEIENLDKRKKELEKEIQDKMVHRKF
ncbi:MAG TPA: DUF4139 domain-containing protein [Candidatus Deferrimicrobium sp.]|nr:DUF4139 domain-containing protein [Candidatus Deferrimicrobium sp.]